MQAGTNDQMDGAFRKFNQDFNEIFGRNTGDAPSRDPNGPYSLKSMLRLARQEADRRSRG
jgi:hypothetical protein